MSAICVWPHLSFSQRATWPPSACRAAVLDRRHHLELAEADMAGVGLAPRPAMAAEDIRNLQLWTSQERRALGGRLGLGLLFGLVLDLVLDRALDLALDLALLGPQRREAIERAHDLADRVGGDARVERRGLKLGMSKQDLDHPNVNVLFEQVGREAMAQGVRRHPFGDLGHVRGGVAGARELTRRHRVDGVLAGEQPALRPCNAIPVAQEFEQHRGKHRMAVLAALACSTRSIMRLE